MKQMKNKIGIEEWACMLALEVLDLLRSPWFIKSAASWKVKNLTAQCKGIQKIVGKNKRRA